jgi:NAD-dependent deacetylase
VVWFGEALDEKILHAIYTCLQMAQVMLIVGTSGMVQPAASFGIVAKNAGAFVAELNRSNTPQSSIFDLSIQGKAGELLPQLVEQIGLRIAD